MPYDETAVGANGDSPASVQATQATAYEALYVEYNAAIGSLIDARQRYEQACTSQGKESWGAEQAQDYVEREVDHLHEVRARYDAASRTTGRE